MGIGGYRSALALGLLLMMACSQEQQQINLLYTSSLETVLHEVGTRFEKNNPAIRIFHQPVADLETISRLAVESTLPDLVAVADPALLERPPISRLGSQYALLAGDEVVLATGRSDLWVKSDDADQWKEGWVTMIFQPPLRFVAADPALDALGYYSRLSWKLAEIHYDLQGLYQRFLLRSATLPSLSGRQVVEALQAGTFDLAFVYRSTALQQSLKHLRLGPEISLGSNSHADLYARVFEKIEIPSSDFEFEVVGRPIRYAVALLNQGDNASTRFFEFLLSDEVQNLFRAMGYRDDPSGRLRFGR